ncbi:tetratricopeptide repeat protein [Chitinophagales bacterium]|nr:tetratricopeptide repeat protein [Chitinophagales bacterium]
MAKERDQEDILLNPEEQVAMVRSRTEDFINANKGMVLGVGALIFLLVAGYLYWTQMYMPSQEKAASGAMYQAEAAFGNGDWATALNGDGNEVTGFLDVIGSYSGSTKSVNLANYYAGISYLNQKNFQEAIDHLNSFSSSDLILASVAKGAMGDAYMELGEDDNAARYYEQAAQMNPNDFSTPMYLVKAGMAREKQGNYAAAAKHYEKVTKNYASSAQYKDAAKLLAVAQSKL